ncbi:MAG TPA: hypothetical protein PLJ08_13215, partial [Cyclobacteriaceae bacterium]|nr:hypothetical protein [Cyclobacteriaceae bacterium]
MSDITISYPQLRQFAVDIFR